MKKSKIYYKQTSLKAVKGADVTPDILAMINEYAQEPLTADDIYVQKYIMAHNGVDRDRERFPENLLDDYVHTLPGKSFLEVHDKSRLPIGLYFKAESEEMSKEQFKSLTSEDIRLPDSINTAKVAYGWIYTLRKDWNQKLIDNLSAGIYRHASIGFSAADLKPVKGEFDQILYWEYEAPGEAREGSIVYLGAQHGATVQKDPDIKNYKIAQDHIQLGEKLQTLNTWLNKQTKPNKEGGEEKMDELKKLLERMSKQFKTHITEDNVIDEVKTMIDAAAIKADTLTTKKDKTITEQGTKITDLEKKVTELTPLASDGKTFREELVKENIRMKAALKDIPEKEEDQKGVKSVVEKHPIDYLKNENKSLQKRMEEKFDDKGQLKGDEKREKSDESNKKMSIVPKEDK